MDRPDEIIALIQQLCDCRWDGEELSFHTDPIFGGSLRHCPNKNEVLRLLAKLPIPKRLNLRKCRLDSLPDLQMALQSVDLSCNNLRSVPGWAVQPSVRHLNVGSNLLTELPPLPDLISLKVHKNRITELPPLPKGLKNLNVYLNPMPLPELPPDLEAFAYGGSKIRSLPPLPTRMRWLTLVVNWIETLPENFTKLPLEGVLLAKNRLKELPEDIGDMGIREITLHSNYLERLPESFFGLKLRKLNLSNNPLRYADRRRAKEVFGNIEFFEI